MNSGSLMSWRLMIFWIKSGDAPVALAIFPSLHPSRCKWSMCCICSLEFDLKPLNILKGRLDSPLFEYRRQPFFVLSLLRYTERLSRCSPKSFWAIPASCLSSASLLGSLLEKYQLN